MESIRTKSGNQPWDIAVTMDGNLVYTDLINRSFNQVINGYMTLYQRLRKSVEVNNYVEQPNINVKQR